MDKGGRVFVIDFLSGAITHFLSAICGDNGFVLPLTAFVVTVWCFKWFLNLAGGCRV